MKKILFIALAAILALSVGLVGCGGTEGEGEGETVWNYTITLHMHSTAMIYTSLFKSVYQPWIWEVGNDTGPDGGKFVFNVTFGEGLYTPETSLDAISAGTADLGQISGDVFDLGGIGYLPWFFPNMSSTAYSTHILLTENWDAQGELDDIKVLITSPLQPNQWFGNVNVTELANFTTPVQLDVRAETAEVPTIEALGANAIPGISTGDLANALNLSTVDGCFFTYSGALAFGIKDVTSYTTEVNLYPRLYILGMNKAIYDALPADAKTLLDSHCTPTISAGYARAHELAQTGAKMGVGLSRIYVLPTPELNNWKAACANVSSDWATEMDGLGYNGTGILDRALELISATPL
ncbi:MAG: hypothetical protein OEU97_03265 [Dehalococcoidia bacterium]|nr:hypothetical protein [Dehalococcoidia bacterium]MDH4299404.1 hypothetical protein [Dehalococcoidia bacterium]